MIVSSALETVLARDLGQSAFHRGAALDSMQCCNS